MLALSAFLGRARIVPPWKQSGGLFQAARETFIANEKSRTFVWLFFVLALPIFPGRPTYCPAVMTLRRSVIGRKNLPLS